MIFTLQHYIEDYFHKLNLTDSDQYAVRLANLYFRKRSEQSKEDFSMSIHCLRTVFYKINSSISRSEFETNLLKLLDSRFKKKVTSQKIDFPGGLAQERRYLNRIRRRTIKNILHEFKCAIEARAIDALWISRKKSKLHNRPEKIAQALLAVFMKGTLGERGLVLRELYSGIGFVDVAVVIGRSVHLMEIKIIEGSIVGIEQIGDYMQTENRNEGWLVLFDARPEAKKKSIESHIILPHGTVHILPININPIKPSSRN